MLATKVASEVTHLELDPSMLEKGERALLTRIRIILIGNGGECKKYTSADGDVVYICGG